MAESITAQDRLFVTSDRLTLGTEVRRTASIRAGDIDGDGDLDLVVANGRHWPEQNFLFVNSGRAKYSLMRPLGADRRTTYACELADFDADDDLDIVTGNDLSLGIVLHNHGDGTFDKAIEYGASSSLRSLTVADIDSDGDVDVLATCRGRPNRIYLNDGLGNLRAGPSFGRPDDSTIDVAVADFDNDGRQDLVLANRDNQPNAILFGDEQLQFSRRVHFGDKQNNSRAIAVADLNNDGHLDCVVGNIDRPNSIYLGDGLGAIGKPISFGRADSRTYCLALADMDGDGDVDIITGNVAQRNVVHFNKEGATAFKAVPFGQPDTATYGICVGDFDEDGATDIAVANSGSLNRIYINRLNLQDKGPQ